MSLVDQLFEHHKAKFANRIEDDSVSPKEFQRWSRMRAWVVSHLKPAEQSL